MPIRHRPALREDRVEPTPAYYETSLGEFLLPYDAVRRAPDPESTLMGFLESTYRVAADLGGWDRQLSNVPLASRAGRAGCKASTPYETEGDGEPGRDGAERLRDLSPVGRRRQRRRR